MFDNGNAEGEGLAGAGGGLGSDVLPLQHRRNTARLDGRGFLIAFLVQRPQHGWGQSQRVKARALCDFHNSFLVLFVLYSFCVNRFSIAQKNIRRKRI